MPYYMPTWTRILIFTKLIGPSNDSETVLSIQGKINRRGLNYKMISQNVCVYLLLDCSNHSDGLM